MAEKIVVKGAREHNLKDISVELPRNKLVVITGLSGSGKSSLAFDTIYAEGQRRYVESLSSYARQFLGLMEKPDVDQIDGLSPAISIDQKSTSRNPRSTVATVTEIYDYLRLLYARIGTPHCPQCGRPIAQQAVEQMVSAVMALPEGARIQVLGPVVRGRKGEYRQTIEEIRKQGFVRVRVDGAMHEVTDEIPLDRYKQHTIEVVVDRLVRRDGIESRLSESVETALKLGNGILGILWEPPSGSEGAKAPQEMLFSEHFACVECGISIEELAPRNFSFNSPYGACPACHGLGTHSEFDGELILDPEKSLDTGAVIPFASTTSEYIRQILDAVGRRYGHEPSTPLSQWKLEAIKTLLNGSEKPLPISYTNRYGRRRSYQANFEGLIEMLRRRYSETSSQNTKED